MYNEARRTSNDPTAKSAGTQRRAAPGGAGPLQIIKIDNKHVDNVYTYIQYIYIYIYTHTYNCKRKHMLCVICLTLAPTFQHKIIRPSFCSVTTTELYV